MLKSNNFPRTNPFDVENALNGLQERFSINNRDGLTSALKSRLGKLQQNPEKWHPEILYLLLELSDQPTFKSELEDLTKLEHYVPDEEPVLRWEDIAREEGWDEEGDLWKPVEYSDYSDDETYTSKAAAKADMISESSEEDNAGRWADSWIVQEKQSDALDAVRQSQAWRQAQPITEADGQIRKIAVSEIQMLREVVFLLHGLKTSLFDENGAPLPSFQMSHVAWDTHKSLIESFAECGGYLEVLREFVEQSHTIPHIQAFQDAIDEQLAGLDQRLSEVQMRLASPTKQEVVSLVALKDELFPWLNSSFRLADIIAKAQTRGSTSFSFLEHLFAETNNAQMTGDPTTYEFLAKLFLSCFRVYLQPIRYWMDEGKLLTSNEHFFIRQDSQAGPSSNVWHSHYRLNYTETGALDAPSFLEAPARKICNAGKNIIVLRMLGHAGADMLAGRAEPSMEYEDVCPKELELAPFSELFALAFERWIESKRDTTSTVLKNLLVQQCGLYTNLNTLYQLYFMVDGAASMTFLNRLFERIDDMALRWYDRYELSGLGQEVFSHFADASRLKITVDKVGQQLPVEEVRDSVKDSLPHLRIEYRLPWSVQMIVTEASLQRYQSIFTFLSQIRRSLFALLKVGSIELGDGAEDAIGPFYAARQGLFWFCNSLQTYLCTVVLAPTTVKIQKELDKVTDIDSMAEVHTVCLEQAFSQCCLGPRLAQTHASILDILDMGIQLDDMMANTAATSQELISALQALQDDFETSLQLVTSELRAVSRESSDEVEGMKWDMLAETLQQGLRGR